MLLHKRCFIIVFCCLALCGYDLFGQSSNESTWEFHYENGINLYKAKTYDAAEEQLIKAYNEAKSNFSEDSHQVGLCAFALAKLYRSTKKYNEAISYASIATQISKKTKGEYHLDYGEQLIYLGYLKTLIEDYEDAIDLYKEGLNILNYNNIREGDELESLYHRLYFNYKKLNDFDNAEFFLIKKLEVIEKNHKKSSIKYIRSLKALSDLLFKKEEFKASIEVAQNALNILESIGNSSYNYFYNLKTNLAIAYGEIGSYEEAIELQEEAIKYIGESANPLNKAKAIYVLGRLYAQDDENDKALKLFDEAISLLQTIQSKSSRHILEITISKGLVYQRKGNYEKALDLYIDALNTIDKSNYFYHILTQNMALLYSKLGDFDKSLKYYNESLNFISKYKGEDNESYAKLLNNIGKMYFQKKDLDIALTYFDNAIKTFLKKSNINHPDYGYYFSDYSNTLLVLDREQEAIDLMIDNLKIAEKNGRTDDISYYKRQHSLANAYNRIKDFKNALPLIESAVHNLKNKLGSDHPSLIPLEESLAQTYLGLKKYDKALEVIKNYNKNQILQLDKIFKFRGEQERKSFLEITKKSFDNIQSIAFLNKNISKEIHVINLNNQLFLKGLLLNNSKNVLTKLKSLNDDNIDAMIIDYRAVKRRLSSAVIKRESQLIIDSLRSEVSNSEVELIKLYNNRIDTKDDIFNDWTKNRDNLKSKEVAIEFFNFRLFYNAIAADSLFYGAYVYNLNSTLPQYVPLFEEKQVRKILKNTSFNTLYKTRGSKGRNTTNVRDLYEIIWSPLEPFTENIENVYFAPSGVLNQIPFAALNNKNSPILVNKHKLVQLNNTNSLNSKKTEPVINSAFFVGGIDYEFSSVSDSMSAPSFTVKKDSNSLISEWKNLPGTLKELEFLESFFTDKKINYVSLSSSEATETEFKKLSGNSPSVIHIATHGFFYENQKSIEPKSLIDTNIFETSEDPLLRSGLLFAGANYAWQNGSNPYLTDDGILSALEISNLDLTNTDIVILSACETGLGDIDGNEGVYGLQRAFKMSGVDYIIMSLWEVPDKETTEFMELFYVNWINSGNLRDAFRNTQLTMSKKFKDDPLKWAAFVLLE